MSRKERLLHTILTLGVIIFITEIIYQAGKLLRLW